MRLGMLNPGKQDNKSIGCTKDKHWGYSSGRASQAILRPLFSIQTKHYLGQIRNSIPTFDRYY